VGPRAGPDGCGRYRPLDRPDRSETLYRLSYPGPHEERRSFINISSQESSDVLNKRRGKNFDLNKMVFVN
jgi:hypothetical protein